MKTILLLSDTHSCFDSFIEKHLSEVDEIWHAGDIGSLNVTDQLAKYKPLRAVYGNIDDHLARLEFPENLHFELEGISVWMTHIGGYPGHFPARIRQTLQELKPTVFICGHSHILRVMYDQKLGVLCLNPGAAGIHGFHQKRTMLRFDIAEGKISNMNIIERER